MPVLEIRGDRLVPDLPEGIPKGYTVRRYDWWPCFVCGVECRCPHREPELIDWFEGRRRDGDLAAA